MSTTTEPTAQNQVVAVGRLGARVERRTLPSGDDVTVFTVIVDRPENERGHARTKVDAIPCQTFKPVVARRLAASSEGDLVRIEGVLRRRFWRTPGGLGSAVEVDVRRLERQRSGRGRT